MFIWDLYVQTTHEKDWFWWSTLVFFCIYIEHFIVAVISIKKLVPARWQTSSEGLRPPQYFFVEKYKSLVSVIYVFQALEITTCVLAQIINEMIHTSLENDCCHALQ